MKGKSFFGQIIFFASFGSKDNLFFLGGEVILPHLGFPLAIYGFPTIPNKKLRSIS